MLPLTIFFRGFSDTASIDARFLAVFDSIACSIGNGSPVEPPANILTKPWTEEYEDNATLHGIMPGVDLSQASLTVWWKCCKKGCAREVNSERWCMACPDCGNDKCESCPEIIPLGASYAPQLASKGMYPLTTQASHSQG
jgi:hypothetical protein